MVTESELVGRLREFLNTSDLNTTTTAIVRRKLEEDFGIDLTDKKAFIREQVDLYLQSQFENAEEEEQEEEADDDDDDDDEAGENDEEEESEHASHSKAAAKKRSKKKKKEEIKKRGGGFTKLCSLSPQLQNFTGVSELARTEVVKKLWSYIREHNLQDPTNRRNIQCDDILRDLFGVDTIDMFQMNKALAKHIWPLDSGNASVNSNSPPKEKQRKQDREEDSDESNRKGKRQKSGNSGILAPLPLSDALMRFLGTGESALPRSGVVKRIWEYIKQNKLQDPSDKRRILCDEKLKELFNVDTFNGFTVAKLLTVHFIKSEQ